jgi:hypothetical protein
LRASRTTRRSAALDRQYRLWSEPRRLGEREVELMGLLSAVEHARLGLARELDEGDTEPLPHPVLADVPARDRSP